MLHRRLSAGALIVSIIALVAALGGTAVAAKLITGKDVRNSSLTGADIKNRSLTAADFKGSVKGATGAPGSPGAAGAKGDTGAQGPAGTPDGYTKGEADGKFLAKTAKAADADLLDGTDGDDLVAGDARITFANFERPLGSPQFDLISVGDIGKVRASCGPDGTKNMLFDNTSSSELQLTTTRVADNAASNVTGWSVAAGDFQNVGSLNVNYQLTLQVVRPAANVLASSDFSTVTISATDFATCRFQAQAVDSEKDATGLVIVP